MLRELARRICTMERPHPLRVAVDGIDAAGKTTLADELVEHCEPYGRGVVRASADDFHRPRAERYARGRYSPEGYYHDSTDYAALVERLLAPLGSGGDREYVSRVFDWREDRPVLVEPELAGETDVLLVDGLFLLRPELVALWDYRVYVDVDFDCASARSLARARSEGGVDEAELTRLEQQRYWPAQRLYLARARPREVADAVVDNTDFSAPRVTFRAA